MVVMTAKDFDELIRRGTEVEAEQADEWDARQPDYVGMEYPERVNNGCQIYRQDTR